VSHACVGSGSDDASPGISVYQVDGTYHLNRSKVKFCDTSHGMKESGRVHPDFVWHTSLGKEITPSGASDGAVLSICLSSIACVMLRTILSFQA